MTLPTVSVAFASPLPLKPLGVSPSKTVCQRHQPPLARAAPAPPRRRRVAAAAGIAGLAAAATLSLPLRGVVAAPESAPTVTSAPARSARQRSHTNRTVRVVASGPGVAKGGFRVAASAALVASAAATLVCHPIDTLKTMQQAKDMDGVGEEEGDGSGGLSVARLYRGVWSNVMKEAPNAAIYLGCYELFRAWMFAFGGVFTAAPLLTFCIAGMLGDAVGSVVRVPAEVVNKRLQLGLSPDARHAMGTAFLTRSGLQATLESWKAVAMRDVPYGGLQIAFYEGFRGVIMTLLASRGIHLDVAAGAASGLLAAVLTTPADVLVTRLSAQNPQCYLETRRFMSPLATARRVCSEAGFGGLWSGAKARGLYYAPLIGVFFAFYEVAKQLFSNPEAALAMVSGGIGGLATFVVAAAVWLLRKGVMRRGVQMAHVGLWGLVSVLQRVKRRGDGPVTE